MVGRLPDARRGRAPRASRAPGDEIALVGAVRAVARGERAGQAARRGAARRPAPSRRRRRCASAQAAVREAVRAGALSQRARHRRGRPRGRARRVLPGRRPRRAGRAGASCPTRASEALFGEGPGGFVVSGRGGALRRARRSDVPLRRLGTVGGDALRARRSLGDGERRRELDGASARATLASRDARPARSCLRRVQRDRS